jgi:hypothetical protein
MDEALGRFHLTGPERSEQLANNGPMVVEAMVRHDHADQAGGLGGLVGDRGST